MPGDCRDPDRPVRVSALIERRTLADCRAVVPDHPAEAPCLLFVPDDGRQADLRLTLVDVWPDPLASPPLALVRVVAHLRMQLEDLRGQAPLLVAEKGRRIRSVAWAPVPLRPVLPTEGWGLSVPRMQRSDPAIEAPAQLARAGLKVGVVAPSEAMSTLDAPEARTLRLARGADPRVAWRVVADGRVAD